MKRMRLLFCVTTLMFSTLVLSALAAPLVMSTFNTDREGWGATFGASVGTALIWQPTGGNPGGNLVVHDLLGLGSFTWYYEASQGDGSPLLGNHANAYGGSLQYDQILPNPAGNFYGDVDVQLSGGGLLLRYTGGFMPGTSWTTLSAPLLASAGWINVITIFNTPPATEAQLQLALSNITDLQIRGNYTSGDDGTQMDNVGFFAQVPEPSSVLLALLGFGMFAAWARHRPT